MEALVTAGWVLGSYLVGSIPFGLLLGKIVFGVDIREHGSRNLGATNAARILGKGRRGATIVFFAVVFLLDGSKGFFPTWLAERLGDPVAGVPLGLFAGAGAVAGHMASIYLRFHGGKGVAVSTGVLVALVPVPVAASAAAWGLGVALTRYVSVGSLVAAVALPIAVAAWGHDPVRLVACGLLSALVVFKHRGNIARLVRGTESRIGGPKAAEGGPSGGA